MQFKEIASILKKVPLSAEYKAYIVGGAVRDMLLGADEVENLDITVTGDFKAYSNSLISALEINGKRVRKSLFMTEAFEWRGMTVDLVTARKEIYRKPGMLPEVSPSSIEDDLKRRDFTVNSIAYEISSGEIIDIAGGMEDLNMKLLRANREGLFSEDPTRLFRFFKYIERLSLSPEESTKRQADEALKSRELFLNVSKSRISKEWMLLLREKKRDAVAETMHSAGLFRAITGEDVVYSGFSENADSAFLMTLSAFYGNETEILLNILDVLLNGLKRERTEIVRRMKRESKTFNP